MVEKHAGEVRPGDRIAVQGHRVGQSRRVGEILEVVGDPENEHYIVRWDDGHESISYPSSDALIDRPPKRR